MVGEGEGAVGRLVWVSRAGEGRSVKTMTVRGRRGAAGGVVCKSGSGDG